MMNFNVSWNKVSNSIKKEVDCKPIYNKKFLKTKITSYSDEATDFDDEEMPKVGSNYICLAVMLIDFVLKKEKNYYLEVLLKNVNILKKR